MEAVICSAIEEICIAGPCGLPVTSLWVQLSSPLSTAGLDLCHGVKSHLWSALVTNPSLYFTISDQQQQQPTPETYQEAETSGGRIVAVDHLRNAFLGISEIQASDSEISLLQLRALQLLALARTQGVTQTRLGKELGKSGNNLFFVVKRLEYLGLISRHSTMLFKNKDSCSAPSPHSSSCVKTNTIYLKRYARHLGPQQRLEITADEDEGTTNEHTDQTHPVNKSPVVNDFVPGIKAVCEMLESAKDNVLVVSDLKKELGYRLTAGHRHWRNICKKLKDSALVEEFSAQVGRKQVKCLRLIKPFSPARFDLPLAEWPPGDEDFSEHTVKVPSRGLVSEQVVELPIEHQVFDIVNKAGASGVTFPDLCRRLSINKKKYYRRLLTMFSRFGMILRPEDINKSKVYRVWTAVNRRPGSDDPPIPEIPPLLGSPPSFPAMDEGGRVSIEEMGEGLALVPSTESVAPLEMSIPLKLRTFQGYPCKLYSTSIAAVREQKILELLEEQKFVLKSELQRHVEGVNPSEKNANLDRKTVARLITKLQAEGLCRCVEVPAPVISNCSGFRRIQVVLHPSFNESISPDLLDRIHDKLRSFDSSVRRPPPSSSPAPVPVLDHLQRVPGARRPTPAGPTRPHAFVRARMVRVSLLHKFLWSHVIRSGHAPVDPANPHTVPIPFSLDAAVQAIPLELFLQVVGTGEDITAGARLMDTRAAGRLSWTVDVLRRLKLIRVTAAPGPDLRIGHALELRPYIEEPLPPDACLPADLRPRTRHDFHLSSPDAVDAYWRTLEFCFSVSDPASALHAFPGSAVPDLSSRRSWTTVREMTAEQRVGVREWLDRVDPGERLAFGEASEVSRRLSVSLHLLLRVFHEKRRAAETGPRTDDFENGEVLGQRRPLEALELIESSSQPDRKRRRSDRDVGRGGRMSVAVANAVELLKVVFLNASAAPGVAQTVAGTLRRYSEHDLFTAFEYLKEKRVMVSGGRRPFIVSRPFLRAISASPFPADSGRRAELLLERLRRLPEGGRLALDGSDLFCGDIFVIFGLVYSGVFLPGPPALPPDGGTGEADPELGFRKHKGFPGISISLIRVGTVLGEYSEYSPDRSGLDPGPGRAEDPDSNLLGSVLEAVQLAGDEGLSPDEISAGGGLTVAAESLCLSGKILEVNSFDSVRYVDALYRSKYSLGSSSPGVDREKSTSSGVHKVTILNRPEAEEGPARPEEEARPGMPILPWLNGDGTVNEVVYKGLARVAVGVVMRNPGILEEDLLARHGHALNPQSFRKLLELLVLDRHLFVRTMHQMTSDPVPACVRRLARHAPVEPARSVYRRHYFANPLSVSML